MSLISYEKSNQLEQELEDIMASMREKEMAVGDTIAVAFDPEFASKHKIGAFGRLGSTDKGTYYHAAPASIWKDASYEYQSRDFMSVAKAWLAGDKIPLTPEQIIAPSPDPVPKKRVQPVGRIYERAMLKEVHKYGEIVLFNPSFGMMTECVNLCGGSVYLQTKDEGWKDLVRDFCKQSGGRMRMLDRKDEIVREIVILPQGSNNFSPPGRWVRMIPNPEKLEEQLCTEITISSQSMGYRMQYRDVKKKWHDAYLNPEVKSYMINPRSFDALVGTSRKWYYLQSSFPMLIQEYEEPLLSQSPKFISPRGEWKKIGDHEWLTDGVVVFDVRDRGTYYSRRGRLVPPGELIWAPLEEFGTHWTCQATVVPQVDPSIQQHNIEDVRLYTVSAQVELWVEPVEVEEDELVRKKFEIDDRDIVLRELKSDDELVVVKKNEMLVNANEVTKEMTVLGSGSDKTKTIVKRDFPPQYSLWKGQTGRHYVHLDSDGVMLTFRQCVLGEKHVVRVLRTCLADYVVLALPLESGSVYFPSVQLYSHRILGLTVGRVGWQSQLSNLGWNAKINKEIGERNADLAIALQLLMTKEISSLSMTGYSIRDLISLQRSISSDLTYRYLRLNRHFILWDQRPTLVYDWQFIHVEKIRIKFTGILDESMENIYRLDGREWSEPLKLCVGMTWGSVLVFHFEKAEVKPFIQLLERNGYKCGLSLAKVSQVMVRFGK